MLLLFRCMLILIFLAGSTGSMAVTYTITDLGSLEGSDSGAQGINDLSKVVGYSLIGLVSCRAFSYDGAMSDLGALSGVTGSVAYHISEPGFAVGASRDSLGNWRAVLWPSGGSVTDLGTLGGYDSSAKWINDAGRVVGESSTTAYTMKHAFLWADGNGNGSSDPGEMRDLGTLGGDESGANCINNLGGIVGDSTIPAGDWHAFILDGNTMCDLGTLGGVESSATCVNDAAQVVGYSSITDGSYRAFLWADSNGNALSDPGEMKNLGSLGNGDSYAYAINGANQVVGMSINPGGDWSAFLWQNDVMSDLNALLPPGSGWKLEAAYGINDGGQIVGVGLFGTRMHAYLMSPNVSTGTIVGQVILQDYPGDITWVPIRVELRKSGGSTSVRTVFLNSSGYFSVPLVEVGTYDLALKADNWLREVVRSVNVSP